MNRSLALTSEDESDLGRTQDAELHEEVLVPDLARMWRARVLATEGIATELLVEAADAEEPVTRVGAIFSGS